LIKIDEDGKWEVQEGDGCINRLLLEPSEAYKLKYPEEFTEE
jgi:hypothetical protein